jgi:hypothetical protein
MLTGSTVIVVTAATALSSMALMAAFLTLTVVEAESVPFLDAGFAVGSLAVQTEGSSTSSLCSWRSYCFSSTINFSAKNNGMTGHKILCIDNPSKGLWQFKLTKVMHFVCDGYRFVDLHR